MKMQDRLVAMIENSQAEVENINEKIDGLLRETEKWRTRRLEIEEEAVEARVTLNFLQQHDLKVWRGENGLVNVSVDPPEIRSDERVPESEEPA